MDSVLREGRRRWLKFKMHSLIPAVRRLQPFSAVIEDLGGEGSWDSGFSVLQLLQIAGCDLGPGIPPFVAPLYQEGEYLELREEDKHATPTPLPMALLAVAQHCPVSFDRTTAAAVTIQRSVRRMLGERRRQRRLKEARVLEARACARAQSFRDRFRRITARYRSGVEGGGLGGMAGRADLQLHTWVPALLGQQGGRYSRRRPEDRNYAGG